MKYYNSLKERSLIQESKRAERAVSDLIKYLASKRMNPNDVELADIMADREGLKRYVYDNKFNGYLNAVYGDAYVPDSKIDEERKQFTNIYNFADITELYGASTRFRGSVALNKVKGTTDVFRYDEAEMATFLEKTCRVELTDDTETLLNYLTSYAKVLAIDPRFDPIKDGFITKESNGSYTVQADKFVLDYINR